MWKAVYFAFCLLATAGCNSWDLNQSISWPLGKEKPGKPNKIVAIWTDTVLYQPNQQPVRGFGGRLMFYEADKEQPVKADGAVVIYAFDETDRDPNNAKPDRKYVFTPEQMPSHYSMAKFGKSDLGHSYSVWLPWDEVGGLRKEISLVVRFEPKDGASVVVGEPSRQLLPGQTTAAKRQPLNPATGMMARIPPVRFPNQPVQQVSYNAAPPLATANPEVPSRRMTTTTISIPPELARNPFVITKAASTPPPSGQPYAGAAVALLPQNSVGVAVQLPPQHDPTPGLPANGVVASAQVLAPTANASSPTGWPETATWGLQQRPRFSPLRSQAPGAPSVPRVRDRTPWLQHPAGSPSAHALPPGSEPGPGTSSAGERATY